MTDAPLDSDERIVPVRDNRLGQSDRLTAGALWCLGGIVALLIGFFVGAVALIAMPLLGQATAVTFGALTVPIGFAAGLVLLPRVMAVDRRASFMRLTQMLRRKHPTARLRLDDPPLRVGGVDLVHGRKGMVALAPHRAVFVAQRVPGWLIGMVFGSGLILQEYLGQIGSVWVWVSVPLACVLILLGGVDVYEVPYAAVTRADAGEGRNQWAQGGDDAPPLLRFVLTHPEDPACGSQWLGGDEEITGSTPPPSS